MSMASLTELEDDTMRSMAIGAVFSDFGGKINSLDFHRKDDLLVTASDDDSVQLYDIANAKLLKTTYHKKHDHNVRIWDLRVNACQGILRLRGRPAVAYDQQGLVFAVAMEGGAIKLFDSRSYDKGPFDTFLVGGDTAEECSVGCPVLDRCLGGGIPCNSLTEIVGESGCGKTQICLQLVLSAQLSPSHGGLSASSLYIHTEFQFQIRRLEQLSNSFRSLHSQLFSSESGNGYDLCDRVFVERVYSTNKLLVKMSKIEWMLKHSRTPV